MFVPRLTERVSSLRAVAIAGLGTAITAVMVATATPAAAAGATTVTLTVDGVSSSVTTSADTVAALLSEQAISYDSSDLVSPGYDAALFSGMSVSWTPATRVIVREDGDSTAHQVVGTTVRDVRDELNLPTGAADFSRLQAISYDDARVYAPSGRKLAGDDAVVENSVAVVHTIRIAFPDDYVPIARTVVKERSPLVRSGGKRVFQEGRNGRKHVVYRNRFVDGKLVSHTVAKSRVVTEAKRRIVRVGTGPNWVGLAACESGGNPNAVNPAGFYGLYQFSLSTWRSLGGKGLPTDYGYWEQTKRAWKLYKAAGRSPWPVCGSRL